MRAALRHARLEAERRAVAAAIAPDPGPELAKVDRQLAELRRDRTDLLTGRGRYAGTPEGDAARQLSARRQFEQAKGQAETSDSWRDRRHWRREAVYWVDQKSAAERTYAEIVHPEVNHLDQAIGHVEGRREELQTAGRERTAWLANHPEAARRLRSLDRELNPLPELPEVIRDLGRTQMTNLHRDAGIRMPGRDLGVEIDLGP